MLSCKICVQNKMYFVLWGVWVPYVLFCTYWLHKVRNKAWMPVVDGCCPSYLHHHITLVTRASRLTFASDRKHSASAFHIFCCSSWCWFSFLNGDLSFFFKRLAHGSVASCTLRCQDITFEITSLHFRGWTCLNSMLIFEHLRNCFTVNGIHHWSLD